MISAADGDDARIAAGGREDALQVGEGECNAALGRRVTRARDVHEDGAALAADARDAVMVKHNDDVVDAIVAPQAFGARAIGMTDEPVVVAILRVVAPAIVDADCPHRKTRCRPAGGNGVKKHFDHCEPAQGRAAVAFPLARHHATAAERARHLEIAELDDAACRPVAQASHEELRGF